MGFLNMSATASDYHEDSDSEWSIASVFGSERAHSVSSIPSSMGALSGTTQNSKATMSTAPPAPQEDIDTAIPLAIPMHTAQRHNDYAGSAAGDASPKEPLQQDEPEVDTAMSLTTHTAEGHHHNDNGSTAGGSPVPHQPASSFDLRIDNFAPLTAIGSLFTPIRSLLTLLAHALPFWKKGEQSHGQQQLQAAGQEQVVSSSGIDDEEEQLGLPSTPPPWHAGLLPYRGCASHYTQRPDAGPMLSFSPVSSKSSKSSDTTLRPDSPADDSTNAVNTAIAPSVLHTAHHDVEMDSEDTHHAPSTACADRLTSPPAGSSRKSSAASVAFLYECRNDTALPADASAPSSSHSSNVIAPTTNPPFTAQSHNTHNSTTAAAEKKKKTPLAPPPQPKPKRKRRAEQTQDQAGAAHTQGLSDLERVPARVRGRSEHSVRTLWTSSFSLK
jgi:hypothetical protein